MDHYADGACSKNVSKRFPWSIYKVKWEVNKLK